MYYNIKWQSSIMQNCIYFCTKLRVELETFLLLCLYLYDKVNNGPLYVNVLISRSCHYVTLNGKGTLKM